MSRNSKLVTIKVKDIKTRIWHPSLPEELVERIKKFAPVFAEVYPITLQEWVDGFREDIIPEQEVAIWEYIAARFRFLCGEHNPGTLKDKEKLFQLALGVPRVVITPSKTDGEDRHPARPPVTRNRKE